jgi:hypothetical protein
LTTSRQANAVAAIRQVTNALGPFLADLQAAVKGACGTPLELHADD